MPYWLVVTHSSVVAVSPNADHPLQFPVPFNKPLLQMSDDGDSNSVESSNTQSSLTTQNNTNINGNPELIAKGISAMLTSFIKDFDSKAVDASLSQDKLSSALDRLTRELDQLLEDAPLPFILQHASKLSNIRKRVSSLNSLLRSIQRRIDNMDRMLSAGLANDKANAGGPE